MLRGGDPSDLVERLEFTGDNLAWQVFLSEKSFLSSDMGRRRTGRAGAKIV